MCPKVFIATIMSFIGAVLASNSPVLLWGKNSLGKPTLQTIPENEFVNLVAPLVKDNMVVAFLEENLSSKDFLCTNVPSGSSCYANLQHISPKTYYANVEDPFEALRSVSKEREFNSVDMSGKLTTGLTCKPGKVVFVNFDNDEKERGAVLEAHDAAIADISKNIDCPVVYMYLSVPANSVAPASRRVRRQTVDSKHHCFREGRQFLLCFTKLSIYNLDKDRRLSQPEELIVKEMKVSNITDLLSPLAVTLETGSQSIDFNISLVGGYSVMSNVIIGDVTFRSTIVEAPTDLSYACGNLTLHAIWKSATEPVDKVLIWENLQFQAPFNSKYDETFKFDDPWNCTGFFSPAILSGLFVVTIMLMIVFTGICWMMDINTMDRFDDPKGKSITISAAE